MPNINPQWAIELEDPLISQKFFESESIDTPDKEKKLNDKIKQLYGAHDPLYFDYRTDESIEQRRTRLNEFTENPNFRNQLEHCIEVIYQWTRDHLPEMYDAVLQRLNIFKEHLLSDYFVDDRSIMYSEAKRNLEIITVSLTDSTLPESFRRARLTNLLGNQQLELCSGGCNTHLAVIAKDFRADFSPTELAQQFIKKFSGNIAIERRALGSTKFTVPLAHEILRYLASIRPVNDAVRNAISLHQSEIIETFNFAKLAGWCAAEYLKLAQNHLDIINSRNLRDELRVATFDEVQQMVQAAKEVNGAARLATQSVIKVNAVNQAYQSLLEMQAKLELYIQTNEEAIEGVETLKALLQEDSPEHLDTYPKARQSLINALQKMAQVELDLSDIVSALILDNRQIEDAFIRRMDRVIQEANHALIQEGNEEETRKVMKAAVQEAFESSQVTVREVDKNTFQQLHAEYGKIRKANADLTTKLEAATQAISEFEQSLVQVRQAVALPLNTEGREAEIRAAIQTWRSKFQNVFQALNRATIESTHGASRLSQRVNQLASVPLLSAHEIQKYVKQGIERDILGNEVHAVNYLINQAARYFSLNFLTIIDPQIVNYNERRSKHLSSDRRIGNIVADYLHLLQKQFTADDFVAFISARLQESLEGYPIAIMTEELQTRLAQLGEDVGFHDMSEIIALNEDESRVFFQEPALKITIAERLVAEGYFEMDTSLESRLRLENSPFKRRNQKADEADLLSTFTFEKGDSAYKIYYANIGLTWTKVQVNIEGNNEIQRRLFLAILSESNGLARLKQLLPLSSLSFLDRLIQRPSDLIRCIGANQDTTWLAPIFQFADSSPLMRILAYNAPPSDSNRKAEIINVFSYFNQLMIKYRELVRRIVNDHPGFIKSSLNQALTHLSEYQDREKFISFTERGLHLFIKNLITVGYQDFTGLTFRNEHFSLQGIDFSGVDLTNSLFDIPIEGCIFKKSILDGVVFKQRIEKTNFVGANLLDTSFESSLLIGGWATFDRTLDVDVELLAAKDCNFSGATFSTRVFKELLQAHTRGLASISTFEGLLTKGFRLRRVNLQSVDFTDRELKSIFITFKQIKLVNIKLDDKVLPFNEEADVQIIKSELSDVTIENFKGRLTIVETRMEPIIYKNCDLSRSSCFIYIPGNVGYMEQEKIKVNLKQFLELYKDQDDLDFKLLRSIEIVPQNYQIDPEMRFENLATDGETFSFLVKLGYRFFPGLDLENENEVVLLRELDLSQVDLQSAQLRNVQLRDVQLNGKQFIDFYDQGCRDFSETALVGDLDLSLVAKIQLHEAVLSIEAADYLLARGVKDFSRANLKHTENLFEPYIGKVGYHFEGAIFPPSYAQTFQKRLQRQERIEALKQSQRMYQQMERALKEAFNSRELSALQYGSINQWDLISFDKVSLPHQGRCLGFTKAFSESLRQGIQKDYLTTLKEMIALNQRVKDSRLLGRNEAIQRQAFFSALGRVESVKLDEKAWEIGLTESTELKRRDFPQKLREAMTDAEGDYTIHLTLGSGEQRPRHQVGIYRKDRRYYYFDSNSGYVSDIKDVKLFMTFLEKVLPASYGSDARRMDYELLRPQSLVTDAQRTLYKPLFSVVSDKNKLLDQDKNKGLLHLLNDLEVERASLYDWGLGYQSDAQGVIASIDTELELTEEKLARGLGDGSLRVDKKQYEYQLRHLLTQKKKYRSQGEEVWQLRLNKEIKIAEFLLPWVYGMEPASEHAIQRKLTHYLSQASIEMPDLRLQRRLEQIPQQRQTEFERRLMAENLKRTVLTRAEGTLKNQKRLFLQSGLSQFLLAKSIFDIGTSAAQEEWGNVGLGVGFLTWSTLVSPRLEHWISESLPLKLKQLKWRITHPEQRALNLDQLLTLGKKTKIAFRVLAGALGNILDGYGLGMGIKQLIEAEFGTRIWEDGMFETTINSISFVGGMALVVFKLPGPAGPVFATAVVTTQMLYYGIQKVKEYEKYELTAQEKIRLFWHGALHLSDPKDLEYLRARQDMVDELARQGWSRLQTLPNHFVGYGAAMGEYVLNERWYQREVNVTRQRRAPQGKIKPGLSFINLSPTSRDFPNSLSRIIPEKIPYAHDLCSPRNRAEPIELESVFWLPNTERGIHKSSPEVIGECQNSFVFVDTRRLSNDNTTEQLLLIDLSLMLKGKARGFPGFGTVYEVHQSLGDLELEGAPKQTNHFLIFGDSFLGAIRGGSDGTNILDLNQTSFPVVVKTNERGVHGPQIRLYKDNRELFTADQIQILYGRGNKKDRIFCDYEAMDWQVPPLRIETLGGDPGDPDIIKFCENVVLTGYSNYFTSSLNWGTRSISVVAGGKPGHIRIEGGIAERVHDLPPQWVKFADLALLKELHFYYRLSSNELVLEKDNFKVTLNDYFNFEQNRSNYALYDQSGSHILPVLSKTVIQSWQQAELARGGLIDYVTLTRFTLYHRVPGVDSPSLSELEVYSEKNQKDNQSVQLISIIEWQSSDGDVSRWQLGSSGEDHLFINGTGTVKGETGIDYYYISSATKTATLVNLAERNEMTDRVDIDVVVLSEELPSPRGWKVAKFGSSLTLFSAPHTRQQDQVGIKLQQYLQSADFQHLVLRHREKNGLDSFWIPLKMAGQFSLAPYYGGEEEALHRISLASSPGVVVINAENIGNLRGIRARNDFVLEMKKSHEKWVLENYYVSPSLWKDITVCITKNAALISSQENKKKCLENDSLLALSELAIEASELEAHLREQQIKRYPLERSRRQIIQHRWSNFSLPNQPLGYLDIPRAANVLQFTVLPVGNNHDDLLLRIHASERNYTVRVNGWTQPGARLSGLRYGALERVNLDSWSVNDYEDLQANLNLDLLHLWFEERLQALSLEESKLLTIGQLILLLHIKTGDNDDLESYLSLNEKGLDLSSQELSTYLDWLETQSAEQIQNHTKTILEASGIRVLLYLAMRAAASTDISKTQFFQCFALLENSTCQVLWESIRQPLSLNETLRDRLATLDHWAEMNEKDVKNTIHTKIEAWSPPTAFLIPTPQVFNYKVAPSLAISEPRRVERSDESNSMHGGVSWFQAALLTIGGSVGTAAGILGYLWVRRYRGNHRPRLKEVTSAAIPLLNIQPTAANEMVACQPQRFASKDDCIKTESILGNLVFCGNDHEALLWLTQDQELVWYGIGTSRPANSKRTDEAKMVRLNSDEIAYIPPHRCRQHFNETNMQVIPFATLYHKLPRDAKDQLDTEWQHLQQKALRVTVMTNFKHQAMKLVGQYWLGECLLHTGLGDSFQAVGLIPNWRENDHRYWTARLCSVGSQMIAGQSSRLTSVSALVLESALLHPKIQAGYTWLLPNSKLSSQKRAIRFLADLLQFGFSYTAYLPSILEWRFANYPGIHAISLGLRAVLSLFSVSDDPSYYYLGVALFLLPQLPSLLEHMGIPVTAYVSMLLEKLSQLFVFQALISGVEIKVDSARVEAKNNELDAASQRVQAGQENVRHWAKKVLFFREAPRTSLNEDYQLRPDSAPRALATF